MACVALAIAATATSSACLEHDGPGPDAGNSDATARESPLERANRVLHEYGEGRHLDPYVTVRHADGSFAYLRTKLRVDGRRALPIAVDSAGQLSSLRAADRQFRRDHRAVWGALSLSAAHALSSKPDDELVVAFAALSTPTEIPATRREIGRRSTILHVMHRPPAIVFETKASTLIRLGKDLPVAGIALVDEAPSSSISVPDHVSDSATFVDTGTYTGGPGFNNLGYYGEGVRVGMIDGIVGCGVFLDPDEPANRHDAFEHLTGLHYYDPPAPCSSDCASDCEAVIQGQVFPGACQNLGGGAGICVEKHGNEVAGRISSSANGEPYHAAKVELFVGSRGTFGFWQKVAELYSWFDESDVRLVNKSWRNTSELDANEYVEDWFARYRGITTIAGSGNEPFDPVYCNGRNGVCVGGAVATGPWIDPNLGLGTPAYTSNFMWSQSTWHNELGAMEQPLEIERPHLVAAATGGSAAHDADRDTRLTVQGTSYAAPVVTGYLALYAEKCSGGQPRSPAFHRMLVRLAAFTPHSFESTDPCSTSATDPFFPTAEHGCDYRAGVGNLDSRRLLGFCEESLEEGCGDDPDLPCFATGEGEVGRDDPSWIPIGDHPGIETAGVEDHLANATALAVRLSDPGAVYNVLHTLPYTLDSGSRVRASFDYYSCPTFGVGITGESDLSVNFDLALCGALDGEPECVYFSEALHDTDEGFDVVLPGAGEWDELSLLLIRGSDETWSACADAEGELVHIEPFAWGIATWSPGVWP